MGHTADKGISEEFIDTVINLRDACLRYFYMYITTYNNHFAVHRVVR